MLARSRCLGSTAPVELGTGFCDNGATDVELADGLLWVVADGVTSVSNVSDPDAPFALGAFPGAEKIAVAAPQSTRRLVPTSA